MKKTTMGVSIMHRLNQQYRVATLLLLSVSTLSQPISPPIKAFITHVKKEGSLFKDAFKACKQYPRTKKCSTAERKSLTTATAHSLVTLAVLATVGTIIRKKLFVPIIPKKAFDHFIVADQAEILDHLQRAIERQNDQKIDFLLDNIQFSKELDQFVVIAAHFGTGSAVEKLLNNGASAQFIDRKNTSLLHHATVRAGMNRITKTTKYDSEIIIDLLIERGAPINHQSGEFQATALMQAAQDDNLYAVKKLLEAKANRKIRDKHNETAFDYARNNKARKEILDRLRLPE